MEASSSKTAGDSGIINTLMPPQTYTVKPGDTLSKISTQYGVPISSITGYKSGDPNKIQVGEVLSFGQAKAPTGSSATQATLPSVQDLMTMYQASGGKGLSAEQIVGGKTPLIENSVSAAESGIIPTEYTEPTPKFSRFQQQAVDAYDQQLRLQNSLLEASRPSQEILSLREQIRGLNQAELEQYNIQENRLAPTFAIAGEQREQARTAAIQRSALTNQLSALVDAQGVQVDAITKALQFNASNMEALKGLQELTQPKVLGTQVNDMTGDVFSIQRDPATGAVMTVRVGNVGSSKKYQQTGTFGTAETGYSFFGVTPDGKIEVKKMSGGVSGGGGGASGTTATGMPADPVIAGYVQLLQSGGKIDDIPATGGVRNRVVEWFARNGQKVPRVLGAEQQKAASNANDGLMAVQTLTENIYNSDGTINRRALLAGETATVGIPIGTTATARKIAVDVIARIRTGAALTNSEERFYENQVPRVTDTDEQVTQKLNHLTTLYAGVAGTPIILQNPQTGEQFLADDMMSPAMRKEVRDAIADGWSIVSF